MIERPHRPRRALAVAVAVLAVLAAACSDDGGGGSGDAGATTTTEDDSHHGDASGSRYGSSMAPDTVSVADVAKLGPGPEVGDTWNGWVALNVCGRFLEPSPAAGPVAGFSTPGDGSFTLAPTEPGEGTGHSATVGRLAEMIGADLATGALTLPTDVAPATLDLGAVGADGEDKSLPGATLRTGDRCGTERAEVQLWVYDVDAVETGEDVRRVVTDPQDVPVVEDGMALVLALSPESSLPTLPPAALVQPG